MSKSEEIETEFILFDMLQAELELNQLKEETTPSLDDLVKELEEIKRRIENDRIYPDIPTPII